MTQLKYLCLPLLAAVLLSACNGAGLFSGKHQRQMDGLDTAMALCVSGNAENRQQMERQLQQLEKQGQKLDAIAEAQTVAVMASAQTHTQVSVENGAELPACDPVGTESSKMIVGRHEQAWIEDVQLALPARVDTGAETASLDARNIEMFERNGKRWVRFEILHPDTGEVLQLERKLKRIASIIQSNSSEAERRPVIKLGITIGHIKQSAEFTLSNRSHLDYQLLIGRNILKDVMIVDVSKINIAPPIMDE